jgi:hypothetical protein
MLMTVSYLVGVCTGRSAGFLALTICRAALTRVGQSNKLSKQITSMTMRNDADQWVSGPDRII